MTSQATAEDPREFANPISSKDDKPQSYKPSKIAIDEQYPSSFPKKKDKKKKKAKKYYDDDDSYDDYGPVKAILSLKSASSSSSPHSKYLVHGALLTVQIIFGISAVVGKIGLPRFHPLTFALYRETSAAILLSSVAHVVSIRAGKAGGLFSGSYADIPTIILCGCGIFASQGGYIIGIKLSGAIAASVWQPSQPIITSAISMILGWEAYNSARVIGIFIAFIACVIMVAGGANDEEDGEFGPSNVTGGFSNVLGQFAFFVNCLGSSAYVIISKMILNTERYESIAVTAFGYQVGATLMAISSFALSFSSSASSFLCSDCEGSVWHMPLSALPAMVWYVTITSSSAYALLTWANKYATGTLVIGYTVIQPVASAILIQALISSGLYRGCSGLKKVEEMDLCLNEPDRHTLIGAVGVFVGLAVIIWTEPSQGDQANVSSVVEGRASEAKSLLEMTSVSAKTDDDSMTSDSYKVGDEDDLNSLEGQD